MQKKDLPQAIEEALNFAESMGFILDASGWANLDEERRSELIDRLPAFKPPELKVLEPLERARSEDPMAAVARLFAAFCALLFVNCSGGGLANIVNDHLPVLRADNERQ